MRRVHDRDDAHDGHMADETAVGAAAIPPAPEPTRAPSRRIVRGVAATVAVALVSLLPVRFAAADPDTQVTVWDRFDRADGPLATADSGHPWTTVLGDWGTRSGEARALTSGYHIAVLDSTSPTGQWAATTAEAGGEAWLILHLADAGNYWRFGHWQGGPYQLQRIVDHRVATPPLEVGPTTSPAPGDRLSCHTDVVLSCSVDGVEVARTIDAPDQTHTRHGLATYDAAEPPTTRFDEVAFTIGGPAPTTTAPPATTTSTTTSAPPPSVPDGSVTAWDGFDRDDGALGMAPSGQPWIVLTGRWGVRAGASRALDPGYHVAVLDTGATVGEWAATTPDTGSELWLILHLVDAGTYWRFGRWQGGPYELQQVTGYGLASPDLRLGATVEPGPGDRLACRTDDVVVCSVNGIEVVRTASAVDQRARHGVAAYHPSEAPAASFDDIAFTTGAPPTTTTTTSTSTSTSTTTTSPTSTTTTTTTTPTSTPPSGAPVVDTFTRPDGVGLGSSDSGHAWAAASGATRVLDGRAVIDATTATVDPGFAAGTLEVVVVHRPAAGFEVQFRVVGPENYFAVVADPARSEHYRVHKVVAGTSRPLDFSFHRSDVAPQDGDRIRIVQRPDDSVLVLVNGTHVFDGGDLADLDVTRRGVRSWSDGLVLDDLVISSTTSGWTTEDTFSRPDSSVLGTPERGAQYAWRDVQETGWQIVGGQLRHTGAGYGLAVVDTSSSLADARVTLAEAGGEAWLVFRHEGGEHYRFGYWRDGTYQVQKITGWGLGPVPGLVEHHAAPPSSGDVVEVRQGSDGQVHTLVNGVVTHSFTDLAFERHAAEYGVATFGTGSAFDDFLVTPRPIP